MLALAMKNTISNLADQIDMLSASRKFEHSQSLVHFLSICNSAHYVLHNNAYSFPIKLDNFNLDYILAYNYLIKTYISIRDVIMTRTPTFF